MAAAAAEAEAAAELAALEAIYCAAEPDALHVHAAWPPAFALALAPRTADDPTLHFCRCTLVVSAAPDYPRSVPALALAEPRGLDDARQAAVLAAARAAAEALDGEPCLAVLCDAAAEALTRCNVPDGDCVICLAPLLARHARAALRASTAAVSSRTADSA